MIFGAIVLSLVVVVGTLAYIVHILRKDNEELRREARKRK